jgi:anthranilate synthase component 1
VIRDTSYEEFRAAADAGRVGAIVREFSADALTPVAAFAALHRPPFGFLLESLVGGERWARYTFLATEPSLAWRYRGGHAERWTPAAGWEPAGPAPDPIAHLARALRARPATPLPGLPRFTGGAVGYLAYDVARTLERLPRPPVDDLGLPDAVFMLTDTVVIFDNAFGRAIVVAGGSPPADRSGAALRRAYAAAEQRIAGLLDRLREPPRLAPLALHPPPLPVPDTPYDPERFMRDVATVKRHIRAGDIFQAVLSRRQDLPCAAPPFEVYRALRLLNPAPYLYHLALDDLAIVGSSPEVLVRVEDRDVTVRPIAGTRPRGATPAEDAALADALRADPKELAEHAMLVDLGRNDVGRVAEFGSVRVTADRVLERYSHVQHLVSEVRGRLRPECDAEHALRACFPAGTVSGAPKVRAMEILDALEPVRRGPYAGAVGYLGWGAAALDTAIAIRTAVLRGGRAHVQAGAGIVADSDPERELAETESKARAVLTAIAMASQAGQAGDIFPDRESPP